MFSLIASTAAAPARSVAKRQLSMACAQSQSVDKLYSIFEEYRCTNYTQELPTRFRKDIIRAATTTSRQLSISATPSKKALISAEGIESVLKNIGQDHRMSRTELESLLQEVGGVSHSGEPERFFISAEQMDQLISVRNVESL